ncbi:hypothetical protein PG996_011949 [Apiospora saccharicola]|uniref:Uncharacterized protein n=1 Tax=Apiospora saccharicola TaxID=335842 RepID=A0ABR1U170_9PEZI
MPDSLKTYQSIIVVNPQGETLLSGRHPLHYISPPTPEDIDNYDTGHIPGISLALVIFELTHRISDTQPNVVILSAAEASGLGDSKPLDKRPGTLNKAQYATIFVFTNCSNIKNGSTIYTGTNAILGIQRGEVRVYGILNRTDRELLVVDTRDRPIYTLTDLTKDNSYLIRPVPCSQPKTRGPPLLILANPVNHANDVSTPHPTTLTRTLRSRKLIS